jgi:hypothetical protein
MSKRRYLLKTIHHVHVKYCRDAFEMRIENDHLMGNVASVINSLIVDDDEREWAKDLFKVEWVDIYHMLSILRTHKFISQSRSDRVDIALMNYGDTHKRRCQTLERPEYWKAQEIDDDAFILDDVPNVPNVCPQCPQCPHRR